MTVIETLNLTKTYNGKPALDNLNLQIKKGNLNRLPFEKLILLINFSILMIMRFGFNRRGNVYSF